jgi:hypothetical protein
MSNGPAPNKPATGDDKGDVACNANFTTPNPSLATVGTAITALRPKIATH